VCILHDLPARNRQAAGERQDGQEVAVMIIAAKRILAGTGIGIVVLLASGCNPVTTGAKLGAHVVGDVYNDADTTERAEKLVGQPQSEADKMFGEPKDTLIEQNGKRTWVVYPVELDVMDSKRFVVEVADGKIIALSKVEKSSSKTDIPRKLILKEKCKGLPPAECEKKLEMGDPLLTIRSKNTNQLAQLYDASSSLKLGKPHYCVVKFDENDIFQDMNLVEVAASTKKKAF
jgi:hypothetical protein